MSTKRQLVYALIIGASTTIALLGLACIPHCDNVTFLLLPGVLMSALIFQQGIHDTYAMMFVALAGITDIAIYALIAFAIFRRRWARLNTYASIVICLCCLGCTKSSSNNPTTTATVPTQTYPTRPTTPPPTFKLFHQTTDSLTLVTTETATDDQLAAILYQLHDTARTHTFGTLHLPQSFIDHRDPIIFIHIYRGPKCASEKYTTGAYPCGPSYHAAADYTLGSFANKDRDDAVLLHPNAPPTELWNPDAPNH